MIILLIQKFNKQEHYVVICLQLLHIDVFASKPRNLLFLNVQDRQNSDRNTVLFNVFDDDKLHF